MNIEVKTVYNPFEKEVTFSYWSRLYGEVRLKFKYIVDPNGSKGIIYTLYNATLGRQMEVVSEEKDFLHDISLIAVLFERYIGRSKDFLIETFDVLISDHIEKYKRIIDTDLYTMIGQLFIVMNVLAAKEPGQVVLSIQDKEEFVDLLMARVTEYYGHLLYITRYVRAYSYGPLRPQLVCFTDINK